MENVFQLSSNAILNVKVMYYHKGGTGIHKIDKFKGTTTVHLKVTFWLGSSTVPMETYEPSTSYYFPLGLTLKYNTH